MQTHLPDRYRLIRPLGQGGMGDVLLCEDALRDGRVVALKSIIRGKMSDGRIALFKHEFSILSHFSHPNIENVYDFGRMDDGTHFFTCEFVEGDDLLGAAAGLREEEMWTAIVQICHALGFIHSHGLIHYDVKPQNIIISRSSGGGLQAKLIDFGLVGEGSSSVMHGMKGTVGYMAPEIVRGGAVDARVDLYSLGATLYHAISGCAPFKGSSVVSVLRETLNDVPQTLRSVNKGVSPTLEAVIAHLMMKDPAERYCGADEVIEAINSLTGMNYAVEARASRQAYVLTSPMVGRDEDLAGLRKWASVLSQGEFRELAGLPDLVHITGDAGMGKATLLREFRIHCQLAGIPVAEGVCREKPERACEPVMNACRELLQSRSAADALHGLGDDCRELVDELLAPEGGKRPEAEMEQLAERVSELLARISRKRPLVLVFHDLHLADEGTLAVMGYLSRKIHYRRSVDEMFRTGLETEVPRILLCVSSRPAADGGDGWQAKLGPDIHPTKMDLRPLTESETAGIVRGMFGSVAGEDMVVMLTRTCRGNPLHVVETLRAAVDAQVLVRRAGRWAIDSAAFASFRVPGSIADTLSQRAAALPDEQRHVVKMLALLGRPAELPLLATICGVDETSLQGHLEELHRKNIIVCERLGDRLTYVVGHPAMARSLLERMAEGPERKRVHQRAAEAIEAVEPPGEQRDEHVVWHLLAAGENARAVEAAPGAARWLVRNRAARTADELCMSVLGLAGCTGAPRLNLLRVATESLRMNGRLEEFFARSREAVSLAGELGMRDDEMSLVLGYASPIADLGRPSEALALLESANRRISKEDDPVLYARLLLQTATVLTYASKARLALEKAQEAESILSQPQFAAHGGLLGEVISWMGYVNISLADPDAAEERFRRALALLPHDEGDDEPRERTLRGLAIALDTLGRNSEAAETFGQVAGYYRKVGDKAYEALCTGWQSLSELRTGRATQAEALLRSAIAMASECGHSLVSFRCAEWLCELFDRKGRLTEPMCHLTRAYERTRIQPGSNIHIRFHLLSARIKLLAGDYSGALKALSDIEKFVSPKENPTLSMRLLDLKSSILMATGGVEGAVASLKEAASLTPQGNMPARMRELRMQAEQGRYTGGPVDPAVLAKTDAVAGWDRFKNKYVAACTFRERGNLGEASRLLDETLAMTATCGTRYDRAAVLIEQCKLANDLGWTARADGLAAEADGLLGDVEIKETLVDHACAKARTATLRGLHSNALALIAKARETAGNVPNPWWRLQITACEIQALTGLGSFQRAATLLQEYEGICAELPELWRARDLVMKALLKIAGGHADAAIEPVSHAAGVFERLGYRLDLAESRSVLAECLTTAGRFKEAEKALKDCREYGESAGAVSLQGKSLAVLAELRLKDGGERVLRPVLSAIEIWMFAAGTQLPELSWRLHHVKGRILTALGDAVGATAAFRSAMGIVKGLWQDVAPEDRNAYVSVQARQRLRKDMHDSVTMGGQS